MEKGRGSAPWLALILVADGSITALWGRGFIQWQQRYAPDWYQPGLDALLDLPEPVLRGAAAGEALLGLVWLVAGRRRRAERT